MWIISNKSNHTFLVGDVSNFPRSIGHLYNIADELCTSGLRTTIRCSRAMSFVALGELTLAVSRQSG